MAGTTDIAGKLTCNFRLRGSGIEGKVNGTNITATYGFFVEYEIDGQTRQITLKGNEYQTFSGTLTNDCVLKDAFGNTGIHLYVNSNNTNGGTLLKHTVEEDDVEISYMGDFLITSEVVNGECILVMRDEAGFTNITVNGVRLSYEINVTYDWDVTDVDQWIDEEDEDWYGELAGSISLSGEGYKNHSLTGILSKTTTTVDGVEVDGVLPSVTVDIGNELEISNSSPINITYTGENESYEYTLTGSFDLGESVNNQILSPKNVIVTRSAKGAAIDADFVWQEGTSGYELTEMFSTTGNCKRTGETKTLPVVSTGIPTVNGVQMTPWINPQSIDVTVSGDEVSSTPISFAFAGSDYMYDYGLSGTFEITGTVSDHDYYGEIAVTTSESKKPVNIESSYDWSSYEDATGYYQLAGYFDLAGSSIIGGSSSATISVGSTPIFNNVQLNAVSEPTSVNFSISNEKELSSDEFVFEYSGEDYDYAYGLTGRFNLNETLGFDEHSTYDATAKCEVNTNPVEIIPYRIPLPKNIAACYDFPAQVEHESGYYTVSGTVCISGTGTIDSICSPTKTNISQISVDGYVLNDVVYENEGLIKIDGSNNVSLVDSDGNDMKYTGSWSGADSSGGIYTLTCEADFTEDSTTRSHALIGNITITKTYNGYHKGWAQEMNIDTLYTTETTTLSDTTEKKAVKSLVGNVLTYADNTTFDLETEGNGATTTITTQPVYIKSTTLRNDGLFAYTALTNVSTDFSELINGTCMFNGCHELNTFTATQNMNKLIEVTDMFNYCDKLAGFYSDMAALVDGKNMFKTCSSLQNVISNMNSLEDGTQMFKDITAFNTFEGNLESLTNGTQMFSGCTSLDTIDTKQSLSNLQIADYMFYNTALSSFSRDTHGDLNSVTSASAMLGVCGNLTDVSVHMPNVTRANDMLIGCTKLKNYEGSLESLTDAKDLFKSAKLTLTTVSTDLSSMVDGTQMFNQFTNLSSYSGALTNTEVATEMFAYTKIASFVGVDLSSLKIAPRMFSKNTVLTTFACDLPAMTNSIEANEAAGITNWKPADAAYPKNGLFNECAAIQSFSGDLSNLVSGYKMFYNCKSLTSFNVSEEGLKSLECGACMFLNCGDTPTGEKRFTSFKYNLGALKDGYGMFWGIDTLTEFNAGEEGLKSLERGVNMFSNCRLDGASVEHILNTIPTFTGTPILPAAQLPANEEEGKGYLQICMQPSAAETFVNLYSTVTGVTPTLGTDGVYSVDGAGWMDFRGWKIGAMIIN